jgi:hypothetical protein
MNPFLRHSAFSIQPSAFSLGCGFGFGFGLPFSLQHSAFVFPAVNQLQSLLYAPN